MREGPQRHPERPESGRGRAADRGRPHSLRPPARGGAPSLADPGLGSRVLPSAPGPPGPLPRAPRGGLWGSGLAGRDPGTREECRPGPYGRTRGVRPLLLPLAGLSLGFRPWAPRGTRARGRRVLRAGSGGLESLVSLLQREVWSAEARAAVPLTVPLYWGEPRPGALSPCQFLLAGFEGFYEGRK